ncbi:replication initiator [Streptomyces sparsus]
MSNSQTPTVLPPGVSALVERGSSPGFHSWQRRIVRLGGCTNPVRLIGTTALVDGATGEVLHRHGSEETGDRLLVACGNRRHVVCPSCSAVYRADTFQLLRAGLVGGKGVSSRVVTHPQVFATLTAPGFGPVHTRRERSGQAQPCRPRKGGESCPHGVALGCHLRHLHDDPRLGEPLCPRCYDYAGAVLWQAQSGQLWHRFTLELRRGLARRIGLSRTGFSEAARLSFAKVAEYQRRGLVHFHAVIRLDGPEGPATPPPCWATPSLLADAVPRAAGLVALRSAGEDIVGPRVLRFGRQVDVRPIAGADAAGLVTSQAVAAYIAKYATKGAEAAGASSVRLRHGSDLALLPVRRHTLRMIATCWWLGGLPPFGHLGLRRWAHMLGYRGHFSTKSRRYSTTLTALRNARTEHRAAQLRDSLGLDGRPTFAVGQWHYAGRGYTSAEALIAASVREGGEHRGT